MVMQQAKFLMLCFFGAPFFMHAMQDKLKDKNVEPLISYGKYSDYPAPCCFIAMVNYKPIQDFQEVFEGRYDNS